MRRALASVAVLLLLCTGAVGAAADVRVLQAVGVVALDPEEPSPRAPRDEAVVAAVGRAVRRVARELLPPEFTPPQTTPPGEEVGEPPTLDEQLTAVLGQDATGYATRFRILEDRGVRPALLSVDPAVEEEYVALVEVHVDAGRVAERLRAVGWLSTPGGGETGGRIWIVLEGRTSFAALDALRNTLVEDLGARSALPVEIERGRAVLAVEADRGSAALLEELLQEAPPALRIVPLSQDGDTLTLLVEWVAAAPASADEAFPDGPESAPAPAR